MLRRYVAPMALGALGYCLLWGAVHLYQDHLLLHAVVQALSQPQPQPQQPPTAPAPTPSAKAPESSK